MICAKCGKPLNKVLVKAETANKSYLKKYGYEGVEWCEMYDNIKRFNFEYLSEPYIPESHKRRGYKTLFVVFCLCIDCTPNEFNFTGEKEI